VSVVLSTQPSPVGRPAGDAAEAGAVPSITQASADTTAAALRPLIRPPDLPRSPIGVDAAAVATAAKRNRAHQRRRA
jgi:hypothetical protein